MCAASLWLKMHKRKPRQARSTGSTATSLAASESSWNGSCALDAFTPAVDSCQVQRVDGESIATGDALKSKGHGAEDLKRSQPEATQVATDAGDDAMEVAQSAPPKPKRQLTLLPSPFKGRSPVLVFPYTVACGAEQRNLERSVQADIDGPKLYYSHTDAVHEYNATINTMKQGGLYRVRPDSCKWLLLWSSQPSADTLKQMLRHQRTNHFPGSHQLGRKDLMWRNISKMHKRFRDLFYITPQSFVLPRQASLWEAARGRIPGAMWIWKPCGGSCGRGIKVLGSSLPEEHKELPKKRGIVQRYIANPLLIDGYKFDLRIYVLVLSYEPLKVFINDEGLVRLATEKYSSSLETLNSRTMHLTNYSVNRLSPAFVQNQDWKATAPQPEEVTEPEDDGAEAGQPSKRGLKDLRQYLDSQGISYDGVLANIKDTILKTLIAVEPALRESWGRLLETPQGGWIVGQEDLQVHPQSCFELYGFDIIIDGDLKPLLLEVNICPSLSSGSPLDKRIKTKLVADILTLVGLKPSRNIWEKLGSELLPTDSMDCEPDLPRPSLEALQHRAVQLRAYHDPLDAIAKFDELAWEIVLEAVEEDHRSGGFTRIYPCEQASAYAQFFDTEESYANVVLRRWYEAGGAAILQSPRTRRLVPAWVPAQVSASRT